MFINGEKMKSYRYLLILFSLIIFSCTTEPENEGCTDDIACNYNSEAEKEDGSCTYADNFGDCCTNQETDECGICYGDNSVCTDCAGNINPCGFDESTLTFDSCPEYMNFDECEGDDCLCSCNGETIENTVFIWSEEETYGFCFDIEETTYLDMYGYAITGFPSQIFELGNLDTLILENNDFSEGISGS